MMTDGILFNLTRNMIFLHEKSDGLTQAESVLLESIEQKAHAL